MAQQVSLTADNTIELLMEDPLPALPQGGYYVVEVTGGFVNNSISLIIRSTLPASPRSGSCLNGADYGSRITGNDFVGGSSASPYLHAGPPSRSRRRSARRLRGTGAFPLPAGLDGPAEPGDGRRGQHHSGFSGWDRGRGAALS